MGGVLQVFPGPLPRGCRNPPQLSEHWRQPSQPGIPERMRGWLIWKAELLESGISVLLGKTKVQAFPNSMG